MPPSSDGAAGTLVDGTNVVTTPAKDLQVAATGALTVNGRAAPAGQVIAATAPPAVAPVPRRPGPPNFAIEPPPPPMEASAAMTMLDAGATAPAGIKAQAEAFADQGGGNVEVTDQKAGAEGTCFLHWDAEGHWLSWKLAVPKAGKYHLWLKACGTVSQVLRKLSLNGETTAGCEALGIAGSGGYSNDRDDWRLYRLAAPVDVPAGPVDLRLENVDGESLNLDWVMLVPDQP